jgi:hypothetical protein
MLYDELNIGYQGGLWELGFQDVAGKQVATMVVVLSTPVPVVLCTGFNHGLQFGNCAPGSGKTYVGTTPPGGDFPANETFTGYSSGAGPGSATVGTSYTLTVTTNFADGTSGNQTFSVQAQSGD